MFSSEGLLRHFLKALFLIPISSIRRSSDSVNQSGLFFISLSASSVAVSTTDSSNLLSRSFVDRRLRSSGVRLLRKSLILFLKLFISFFLRIALSIFFGGSLSALHSFFFAFYYRV